MKRIGLVVGLLMSAQAVLAASPGPFGTKQSYLLNRMFTGNGYFGFPGEIAAPFTCDSTTERSTYYDTVLHAAYICNGTAWGTMGGLTSPVAGDIVATGKWTFGSAADAAGSVRLGETASCIVFEGSSADASETSICVTNPTADLIFNTPNASAGTYSFLTTAAAVTVAQGGTGLAVGTSGGIPYFSGPTSMASSGLLTLHALLVGGGAGASPTVVGSLGTSTTLLHGAAAGDPTFSSVVEGDLGLTDVTTANATASAHGLLPKLSNTSTTYLSGTGVYSTPAGSGANTALSNLASVAVNTSLLPGAGTVDLGATATPFRNVYILGTGTFGSGDIKLTAAPGAAGEFTWTFPNVSTTVAGLGATNTWSAPQTFNTASYILMNPDIPIIFGATDGTGERINRYTALTPDGGALAVGSTSESWRIYETADGAFDFANGNCASSACTDPSLWIFSHNQSTAQWGGFWHDATNFNIKTGTGAVKISNHLFLSTTAPALTACGGSPTIAGSDGAGKVTTGTGASLQSCTLTFNVAYAVAPACTVSDETTILLVRATSTTTTLVLDSAVAGTLASQVLAYICVEGS